MNTRKNVERINKEKTVDYERKMATLNAEINLTQNLYNSFVTAKSKAVKKSDIGGSNWATIIRGNSLDNGNMKLCDW